MFSNVHLSACCGKKGLDSPGLGECDMSASPVALAQDSPTVFNKENCRMMYNQQGGVSGGKQLLSLKVSLQI